MKILSEHGLAVSEDKTKFCGYMHPECMALVQYAIGRVVKSTTLMTCAALARGDRVRWVVCPKIFDLDKHL